MRRDEDLRKATVSQVASQKRCGSVTEEFALLRSIPQGVVQHIASCEASKTYSGQGTATAEGSISCRRKNTCRNISRPYQTGSRYIPLRLLNTNSKANRGEMRLSYSFLPPSRNPQSLSLPDCHSDCPFSQLQRSC
jgi:hypothetical protein